MLSIIIILRHPQTSGRPTASAILRSLTYSNVMKEDGSYCRVNTTPALQLGAPLKVSKELFPDLQNLYLRDTSDDCEDHGERSCKL